MIARAMAAALQDLRPGLCLADDSKQVRIWSPRLPLDSAQHQTATVRSNWSSYSLHSLGLEGPARFFLCYTPLFLSSLFCLDV
jgi:hypothetical protein